MTYVKPEQPPPRMPSRSDASGVPRFASERFTASTALGVKPMESADEVVALVAAAGVAVWVILEGSSLLLLLRSCSFPRGPLLPVVGDRPLDRVLGEHRAVDLDRREVELVDDVDVLDLLRLVDALPLDPLGGER